MSGTEAIKGFDYQIAYSLFRTLELITLEGDEFSIKFESLNEEEEDFNVIGKFYREYHQIKKRNEGNNWNPADLKEIFRKFLSKDSKEISFYFVTNGTANTEVKELRDILKSNTLPDDLFLEQFLPKGENIETLKTLLKRTNIQTRFFVSDDDADPAKILKKKICDIINNFPFSLNTDIESAYNNLWKYIYDASKTASEIRKKAIIDRFKELGVNIDSFPWAEYPSVNGFQCRKNELAELTSLLSQTQKVVVYGINGIGKSWIITKLIQSMPGLVDNLCWIEINGGTTADRIIFLITSFMNFKGFNAEAENIRFADSVNKVKSIINVLRRIEISIVFDSINSGNYEVKNLICQLIGQSLNDKLKGILIFTSTQKIDAYSELDKETKLIGIYDLMGFTFEDTKEILIDASNFFKETDIETFYDATKGHPMSIHFLKKLLLNRNIDKKELENVKSKSIEVSRDWIIRKTIENLTESSKNYLFSLSIFNRIITFDEAVFILNEKVLPKYLLKELIDYNLVNLREEGIVVHDSIAAVACDMLSTDAKNVMHGKLVNYYFRDMELQKSHDDGILYDSILKWGYHIEKLNGTSLISENFTNLLNLENDLLQAIWGVSRYGYPFDFESDELIFSEKLVEKLLNNGLIKKNVDPNLKFMGVELMYTLDKIDFWGDCLVTYMCKSRNLAGSMGYIPIFKENFAWFRQGLSCQWEHCIEFMPVPPLTKAEKLQHSEFIRKQFEDGAYEEKTADEKEELLQMMNIDFIDDYPDEVDKEMEARSCPLYGHCCPGGIEQVNICIEAETEYYENNI